MPINPDKLYERFLVTGDHKPDVGLSVSGETLRNPSEAENFLNHYRQTVGAEKPATAASRFSYHTMRPMLRGPFYCLGRWNRCFGLELNQMIYQQHNNAEHGHEWGVMVENLQWEKLNGEVRPAARDEVMARWINRHYRPMFETLEEISGLNQHVLWENLAHVLALYYPRWIKESEDEQVEQQFREDFDRLHDPTIGSRSNPLAESFNRYDIRTNFEPDFQRQSCCLNYRLEEYCGRCPLPES